MVDSQNFPVDRFFVVAVHGGAGYHDPSQDSQVKTAMRLACAAALDKLRNDNGTAVDAVEKAICVLEDDECLNAGYGSNLTVDGQVECDAAVMDGRDGSFGSVGAVPGVKNPIRAARAVMDYSKRPDRLGRIPPMTLVSLGARQFAGSTGCEVVSPEILTSPKAKKEWQRWKTRLDDPADNITPMLRESIEDIHQRQDTVGAVVLDAAGHLAGGVSSGGLLLKYPGRIGEAAVFGAGCWAQNMSTDRTTNGMACSISGSGEYIIQSTMAQSLWREYHKSTEGDVHRLLKDVLTKFREDRDTERSAGVLMLTLEADEPGISPIPRLWCGFTADSMAIAYATSADPKPKVGCSLPRVVRSARLIHVSARQKSFAGRQPPVILKLSSPPYLY
ncbi:N-terminal nucleophile aminohydrolase [Gloeophyllum trabeum ATCC 11539]|uniref:N-terminal nucleophile aminohydrolase n=1 Tax=Gloeophyllum trabeum (strain ATCC 11539 / FP-39264 / Madison 617) TaxID=670483 RepID=S7QBG0_GLOTA|nr:N-terminal nucleophile aminohydrolase [Gloeophyllum trabeum ATCC 11539]EPQ57291.1 N-terminal nucleophile aminohydrolase [Gloeophyllum trabeum ATCC 11539]